MATKQTRARRLIRGYLADAKWSAKRLAELCKVNETGLNHVITGRRPISLEMVLLLERGTRTAKAAGLTEAAPLLARELLPPNEAARLLPTGTD